MNEPAYEQMANRQKCLPTNLLESVRVEGRLRDLACELSVTQVFANQSETTFELTRALPAELASSLPSIEQIERELGEEA